MLTEADRAQIMEAGISPEEIERQLRLFATPPPALVLDRPCTVGDGIRTLGEAERATALESHARAAAAGRLLKFVPASGAATRMFQALLNLRDGDLRLSALRARAESGDTAIREVLAFADGLPRFAFAEALSAVLARRGRTLDAVHADGDLRPVVDALLDGDGLDYAALPKALLLFHRYPDGSRTAFEEHLDEGAAYARDGAGVARLHLTVSPEHDAAFRAELGRVRARCERRTAARLEVGFSVQKRGTDTIAADADNVPFRTDDGRLVFRPGGHGALIENLHDLQGDVVFLKTIDNIQPEHRRGRALECLRLLTGHLVAVQDALFRHRGALAIEAPANPAVLAAARRFAGEVLGADVPAGAGAADLARLLDRPLRVCGVVRNTGEPGGGPFWVREPNGACTAQIVESAQVDQRDARQRAVLAAATHFNPVLMACGVRDWRGRPFDLRRFVDPSAVFIARKSKDGRALQALERPGLWNGAMARWHTVFVELPLETFTPVKTVNDLLRPAHQPPD